METMITASNVTSPTRMLQVGDMSYAYRRFGAGPGLPLLCLQHFTGTLDNWDPAVTDPLATGREVILFDSAGVGRSSGATPGTVAAMAMHAESLLNGLGVAVCDVLGFSLGGMVAQQLAQDCPSRIRRMILAGTAPRGGEDIMRLDKPGLAAIVANPALTVSERLVGIFFAPTDTSQAAGAAFVDRLARRREDLDRPSGPEVAAAQVAAFREWERFTGDRFADLRRIPTPTLVVNGVHDEMISVANSYWLVENLRNAVLLVYPDSGHGSLFQFHASFTRQAAAFLEEALP
jgi:pimeloyl-ACP methyl ester carboxylesterase